MMLNILKEGSLLQSFTGDEAVDMLNMELDFVMNKDSDVTDLVYYKVKDHYLTNYHYCWKYNGIVYQMHVMAFNVESKIESLCQS
jgi:hypothetical protein